MGAEEGVTFFFEAASARGLERSEVPDLCSGSMPGSHVIAARWKPADVGLERSRYGRPTQLA
jgi:hypothetical protein